MREQSSDSLTSQRATAVNPTARGVFLSKRTRRTLALVAIVFGCGGGSIPILAVCIPDNFDLTIPSNFTDPITFALPGVVDGGGVPALSLADSAGNAVSSPQAGTYGSLSLDGNLATYAPTAGSGTPTDTFYFVVTTAMGCPNPGSASTIGVIDIELDAGFSIVVNSTPPTADVTAKYADFLSRSTVPTPNLLYTFLDGSGPLVREVSGNTYPDNQDLHLNPEYLDWKSESTGIHVSSVNPVGKWMLRSLNPDVVEGALLSNPPYPFNADFSVEMWVRRTSSGAGGLTRLVGTSKIIECNPFADLQGFNAIVNPGVPQFFITRSELFPAPPPRPDGDELCLPYFFDSGSATSPDTLQHIVFRHEQGTSTEVFVDGEDYPTTRVPHSVIYFGELFFDQDDTRLYVLETASDSGLPVVDFEGDVYLVAVYRDNISHTDIATMYAAGVPWIMADLTLGMDGSQLSVALQGAGPWDLTWSDGVIETGVMSNPHLRTVAPSVDTTYSISTVADANYTGLARGAVTVSAVPVELLSFAVE